MAEQATSEATETVDAAASATEGATSEAAAATQSASTETAGTGDGGSGSVTALVRPEGLPDQFWDAEKGLKVGDLAAAIREHTERLADVPAKPEDYDLALSDAVKVPEGFDVQIDKADPFFAEVTAAAHEAGVPKAAFQKFVDAYAKAQIANQNKFVEDFKAERAKLGEPDKVKARLDAISNFAATNLPTEQAKALLELTDTAEGVKAVEALIKLARKDPAVADTGHQPNTAPPKGRAQILYG